MDIQYFDNPIPHVIIKNFFDEQELSNIWKELEFLTNSDVLLPPEKTVSATYDDGTLMKKNNGVFLYNIYNTQHPTSHILRYNRKIWNPIILEELISKNVFFNMLRMCNQDTCLLSYYENGDVYPMHSDAAVFTMLTHFYKEPKQFDGGDLILHPDKVIENENNRVILFPSFHKHAVTKLVMSPEHKFSGYGRYTISQFFGIKL